MAITRDVDLRVLGGLPITVAYTVGRAEPDVGIMSDYVDDWWITHVGGRPVKNSPEWLLRRLRKAKVDMVAVISDAVAWED